MNLDDPLVALIASIHGQVDGGEWVMVVSCFVDEAGTGDEPNVILAGLVADLNGWLAFNSSWQEQLNEHQVPFAHMVDMKNTRGVFADWDTPRSSKFSRGNLKIIKANCAFGFTVSLSKQLYHEQYRADFPPKVSPDSAYGLCAREVFGRALTLSADLFGYEGPINFIFESGHKNSGNAAQIFQDLKAHSTEGERYGFFALADKQRTRPLQGADQIAYLARRHEPEALRTDSFKKVLAKQYAGAPTSVQKDGCPIFYYGIKEDALTFFREQALVLRKHKQRSKSDKGKDRSQHPIPHRDNQ